MINQQLTEIRQRQAAHEYIMQSLKEGKDLSELLLDRLDLESGMVVTCLPAGADITETSQFSQGRKLSTQLSDGWLVSRVSAHLLTDVSALCVFENALARPTDPWIQRPELRILSCGNSVYHILTSGDYDPSLIQLTIKKARSVRPPLIGVLSRSPVSLTTTQTGTVGQSELESIAQNTEHLVIGAYDGEGFLVWSRLPV